MQLHRGTSGWVWGNIVFGGLIGLVVDASTGAMYKLTPEQVHAQFQVAGAGQEAAYGAAHGAAQARLEDDQVYIFITLDAAAATAEEEEWEVVGWLEVG
jgi:hypothetical protein